ncbi:hypothetical protein TI05_13780 [Achromatium sp. WMS3]|nr:hypothetical protein TI05_13780 [Achromatium sp. WMS3]
MDKGGLTKAQTFAVKVIDQEGDTNVAPTAITLDADPITENVQGGVIGNLTVTDPNDPDGVAYYDYSVADPRFTVNNYNGELRLKSDYALDFEVEPKVAVTVTAIDDGGLSTNQTFTINVLNEEVDVNETPTAIALDTNEVTENVPGGVIGNLTVTDPNGNFYGDYSVNDPRFMVDGTELRLASGVELDYESTPTIDVTVTARDSDGLTKEQPFTIKVLNVAEDVNANPTAIALDTNEVYDNIKGAFVGNLTVTDANANDTFTYSVDDDSNFRVVPIYDDNHEMVVRQELWLKNDVDLDYETTPTVDVTVTARDSGGLTVEQLLTVTVHENETLTAIALTDTQVTENVKGDVVGDLVATDPNDNNPFTYSVSDPRFIVARIYDDNGEMVVRQELRLQDDIALDHDATPTVDVKVTATDSGGLTHNQVLTVNVLDHENVAPTAIALDHTTVTENVTGAFIGRLTTTDPNADNDFTYSVSDPRFDVVGNELRLQDDIALDHEATPKINLEVTVTDNGGLTYDETLTIDVANDLEYINEAPTAITLDKTEVTENHKGDVVGNLTVTDPNDPEGNGKYTYSVVNDSPFMVDGTELRLKDGTALDYEATETHTVAVTVTATDELGLTYDQTFNVNVLDEAGDTNVAPTEVTLDTNEVTENVTGATVGYLTATDPEGYDTYTYSVDDSYFEVVDGTTQLKLKDDIALDYDATSTGEVKVAVTATDSGGLSKTQILTINVVDEEGDSNTAPTALTFDNINGKVFFYP